MLILNHFII